MPRMDSARRQRALKLLGLETWQRRGVVSEPVPAAAAEASRPAMSRPAASDPAPARAAPAASRPPLAAAVAPRPASVPAAPVPAPAAPREVPGDWNGLRAAVAGCEACKLCRTRTHTVFGVGDEQAPLMIVGEGPGADEDARGEPFVGRAGQLLDEMLKSIGRSRQQHDAASAVFIANVVKCRPPGNRDPEADEVEACRPYLDRQIELVRPKLIVALGRVAAQRLLDTDAPLSRLRGPLYHYGAARTPLLITYHPAYLLRSPREKAKSWDDLKKIHQFLTQPAPISS